MLQQGALVALTMFVAGLIYHAGRLSERVDGHTNDIRALRSSLQELKAELRTDLAELKAMIRASLAERRSWREERPESDT